MRIANLLSMQLPVDVVGPNGDQTTVQLQPNGKVDLPEGFKPVKEKLKGLFIYPETETTPAEE